MSGRDTNGDGDRAKNVEWVAFEVKLTEEEADKIVGYETWPPIRGPWPSRVRKRFALWLTNLLRG